VQGSGEISPLGVLYAVRYLASFLAVPVRALASIAPSPTPQGPQVEYMSSVCAILGLAKREGLVTLIAAILSPEVIH
jgi:hypothetical protein